MPETGSHFIYTITPRTGFAGTMTAAEEAVMDEHFAYLQGLLSDGRLVLAGPCLDSAFGVVILRAATAEEARGIMAADPSVRAGIMRAELHPFKISLS